MTKILFTWQIRSSFTQKDVELLGKHYEVRSLEFFASRRNLWRTAHSMASLIRGLIWADVIYSWFADINSLLGVSLSKLLRKKSIVIVAGYDVANVPEIGYGLLQETKSKKRVKYVLDNADRVLTVDESLKQKAMSDAGADGKNISTIPFGYNSDYFKPEGKKEDMVLTVAVADEKSFRRKGIDVFLGAAALMNDINFVVVGSKRSLKGYRVTENVIITDFLTQDELICYYQRAKVYCQLSLFEGLPNALCEAMLCECVPVGTQRNGIPTAIGDTGFYVPCGDVGATVDAIKSALRSDQGGQARDRIKNLFPEGRRENELRRLIEDLMNPSTGPDLKESNS